MYDVNVNKVLCFPAINSGSSRRFGWYTKEVKETSSLESDVGEEASTCAVARWAAWSYEKHLKGFVWNRMLCDTTRVISQKDFYFR